MKWQTRQEMRLTFKLKPRMAKLDEEVTGRLRLAVISVSDAYDPVYR